MSNDWEKAKKILETEEFGNLDWNTKEWIKKISGLSDLEILELKSIALLESIEDEQDWRRGFKQVRDHKRLFDTIKEYKEREIIKNSAIKFINSGRSKEKCKWIKDVKEYVAKDLKIDTNTASIGIDKLIDDGHLIKSCYDEVYADRKVFSKKYNYKGSPKDHTYIPPSFEELVRISDENLKKQMEKYKIQDNKQNKKKKRKFMNIRDYL